MTTNNTAIASDLSSFIGDRVSSDPQDFGYIPMSATVLVVQHEDGEQLVLVRTSGDTLTNQEKANILTRAAAKLIEGGIFTDN